MLAIGLVGCLTEPEYQLQDDNRLPASDAQEPPKVNPSIENPLAENPPVDIQNPMDIPEAPQNGAPAQNPMDPQAGSPAQNPMDPQSGIPAQNPMDPQAGSPAQNPEQGTAIPINGANQEASEADTPFLDTEASKGKCTRVLSPSTPPQKVGSSKLTVLSKTKLPDTGGALLVEIVANKPKHGNVVILNLNCDFAAQLQYELPKEIGTVYAVYFIDQNGDGPSEDDIRGISPPIDTNIETEYSFTLSLAKDADISPLSLPFIPPNFLNNK